MPGMTATVKRDLYKVDLSIQDGPPITDAFGRSSKVTGVTLIYVAGRPTAIRFESDSNPDVFVDPMDMDKPESWPTWLRALVDDHGPSRR